jgi:hypothetical protein
MEEGIARSVWAASYFAPFAKQPLYRNSNGITTPNFTRRQGYTVFPCVLCVFLTGLRAPEQHSNAETTPERGWNNPV